MRTIDFNTEWECWESGGRETARAVSLPHDAMQWDPRKRGSASGVNLGWIDAHDYTYEKVFFMPEEEMNSIALLHFEGAMRRAVVYINGRKAACHEYGYTAFDVPLNDYLKYGEKNVLRVECLNHDQPNSRWYTGTGLYRPVYMMLYPRAHILPRGIKVRTLDLKRKQIAVEVKTTEPGTLNLEFLEYSTERIIARYELPTDLKGSERYGCITTKTVFEIPDAKLWSPEEPNLYQCRITFRSDTAREDAADVQMVGFGIRTLSWSRDHGLSLNGKHIILRGACIHHDNGILGAAAFADAEYRKVRLMKENGYNAIRSAHNPCSEAMLQACDELGILLMNEYTDSWYIHKTKFDYASSVEKRYREDLKELVDESFNHPSVILYSTGNEVAETAQKKGIALTRAMTEYLHHLDPTRPVTCGINIFFNFLSAMGFGVYSDKKADEELKKGGRKKAVGSEFFNNLAGVMGADFMKFGASLYPCDIKTRGAFAAMDVAGYNYGINRYKKDLKKYPDRLILGSETFCSDAYQFYELAKIHKRLIGDFVWSGMDYLGEVGVGAWEYKEYAPDFQRGIGWVSAGSGRVDLTGKPLAEAAYTQVAFDQKKIALAAVPAAFAGQKHSPSAWKMTNAIESWSFSGCDGKMTDVEVYARGQYVRLLLNNKEVGRRTLKNDCKAVFRVAYQDGTLTAISYDRNDTELARTSLKTAGEDTKLTLTAEKYQELLYVRAALTDAAGNVKPLKRTEILFSSEGGDVIASGSGCPYYTKPYTSPAADTYYGEAVAVIRMNHDSDSITVQADSEFGTERIVVS